MNYDQNNVRHAIALLNDYSKGHFNIYALAGPSNSGVRQELMTALMGSKMPKAKCGINALQKAFFEAADITTGKCQAERSKLFQLRCREMVAATVENKSSVPSDAQIVSAFQLTAEAVGGDILVACEECGEEPVIPRECVADYIDIYGGKDKAEVVKWLSTISFDDMDSKLDSVGVPRTWN